MRPTQQRTDTAIGRVQAAAAAARPWIPCAAAARAHLNHVMELTKHMQNETERKKIKDAWEDGGQRRSSTQQVGHVSALVAAVTGADSQPCCPLRRPQHDHTSTDESSIHGTRTTTRLPVSLRHARTEMATMMTVMMMNCFSDSSAASQATGRPQRQAKGVVGVGLPPTSTARQRHQRRRRLRLARAGNVRARVAIMRRGHVRTSVRNANRHT